MATKTTTKKKASNRRGAASLAEACKALQRDLVADLRRVLADREHAEDLARFKQEHAEAAKKKRTGHPWSTWLTDRLEQIAASWVLGLVFIRYAEDRGLLDPVLSGPLDADPSRDRHRLSQEAYERYYGTHPTHAEPEYLAHILTEAARLPALGEILGEGHALLWSLRPSIEGARMLREFFRAIDDVSGQVRWRFDLRDASDELNGPDTRFLGDLYQDLSEHAKKSFALLQTPDFIEKFILDRTLDPAMKTFAEELRRGEFRMIDPTCGSGHFLLGALQRLLRHWNDAAPGLDAKDRVQRALDGVWGCDLNPFAVAIARFRLLVAALEACGVTRLKDAPRFAIHLAVGDALLHGRRLDATRGAARALPCMASSDEDLLLEHLYAHEDRDAVSQVLSQRYHAVVGNPPYITPKDRALNVLYRDHYGSCSGKYALSVPFMERFVELAVRGEDGARPGYVGKITSNSFMKREFGTTLVADYFRNWDLTTVIDTSGAYIPGHGTPTVILFMRNQTPSGQKVRSVLGIRGEPETPADPARGLVWQAILEQIDQPGSESAFVSVEDREHRSFAQHPWSVAGGGASQLKERLEARSDADRRVGKLAVSIGPGAITGDDDVFTRPRSHWQWQQPTPKPSRGFVEGDVIRDWSLESTQDCLFPYDVEIELLAEQRVVGSLWVFRTRLWDRATFGGGTYRTEGRPFWEFHQIPVERNRTPRSIAFAAIATHNHFVFDRGGKVFKQSAPVIKLPANATDGDHFALLGVLNSSTVCFYLKQVCYPKASASGDISTVKMRPEANRYDIGAAQVEAIPLPAWDEATRCRVASLAEHADTLASWLSQSRPASLLGSGHLPDADAFEQLRAEREHVSRRLVALQEEIDWEIYAAYGLVEAVDAVTSRGTAASAITGFARAGRAFCGEAAVADDRDPLWALRRRAIEGSRDLRLVDSAMFKRPWWGRQGVYGSARTSFDEMFEDDLDAALLERLEALPCWKDAEPRPRTTNELADLVSADARFMELLRLRTGEDAPNVAREVASLVADECVPFLPGLYLKPSGMRKRLDWEECWRLQRLEDPSLAKQEALLEAFFGSTPAEQRRARQHVACWLTSEKVTKEKLGDLSLADREAQLSRLAALRDEWRSIDAARQKIVGGVTPPVPPEYKSADFQQGSFWRHRGKLDVAKERFISYPALSPDADPSLLVGWAGWNHLERAKALNAVVTEREREGWAGARLRPAVRGVFELLPWLRQWHANEPEGDYGEAFAAYLASLLPKAALTERELEAWQPTVTKGRGRRAKATDDTEGTEEGDDDRSGDERDEDGDDDA